MAQFSILALAVMIFAAAREHQAADKSCDVQAVSEIEAERMEEQSEDVLLLQIGVNHRLNGPKAPVTSMEIVGTGSAAMQNDIKGASPNMATGRLASEELTPEGEVADEWCQGNSALA
eukprot:CAMPEP_0169290144 /NCGR_PEP_ID=MMETSP1016-20121227/61533_1 /TAXON_ID=342587 /ORGANISM="Karlodinium micrum, Strain CCMP2283" /LENGTH=117 /DNA_ID=CAMNT_0009380615 /DNA_START=62 /DNA_END=415 /DNA_ORIENTATION=+